MKYNYLYNLFALRNHMKQKGYSERSFSLWAGVSRLTLRAFFRDVTTLRISTLTSLATPLERDLYLISASEGTQLDYSSQMVGANVLRDGFDSWKIHFMNLVDEFRQTLDSRLLLLPPPRDLPLKLKALLGSIVLVLCEEAKIDPPRWANRHYALPEPWFVSESDALKAITLRESPLQFKKNNIFVGENFLSRV